MGVDNKIEERYQDMRREMEKEKKTVNLRRGKKLKGLERLNYSKIIVG